LLVPLSRVLLGMFRPLADVAYFSLAEKLASEVRASTTHIATAVVPAASDLEARADRQALAELFARACRWTLMALVPLAVLAASLGGRFIGFWVNPEFGTACDQVLPILVPALCLVFFSTIPGAIARGLGRAGPWVVATLAALAVNLVAGLWLIPRGGMIGAALSLAVAGLATTLPLVGWVARRLLVGPAMLGYAFPWRLVLLGAGLSLFAWHARTWAQSLAATLLAGALGGGLFLTGLWVFGCTREEREIVGATLLRPVRFLRRLVGA